MKNYKLVNSREVQEKAFRLGYSWNLARNLDLQFMNDNFITVNSDGYLYRCESRTNFIDEDLPEITQKDFLALPEPLKVGDWVKVKVGGLKYAPFIAKISSFVEKYNVSFDGVTDSTFNIDHCTKLTPEQIKILELDS